VLRWPLAAYHRSMVETQGRYGLPSKLARTALDLWHTAADFIVPPVCLGCKQALGSHDCLCAVCWRQVAFIRAPLCDRLGLPMPYDTGGTMVSASAVADPPDYDRARAVARFEGLMRKLVHGMKYSDRHDARRLFGTWMAAAGAEVLADADLIVPVPMHRWRLLSRRFNQSAIIAQEVAAVTGHKLQLQLLERVRATPQQVGMTRDQRRLNMSGAFKVAVERWHEVEDKRVVLIDDVITTGATINACARALKRAGAAQVDVLALGLVIPGEPITP
jgi:ComF family protein